MRCFTLVAGLLVLCALAGCLSTRHSEQHWGSTPQGGYDIREDRRWVGPWLGQPSWVKP